MKGLSPCCGGAERPFSERIESAVPSCRLGASPFLRLLDALADEIGTCWFAELWMDDLRQKGGKDSKLAAGRSGDRAKPRSLLILIYAAD